MERPPCVLSQLYAIGLGSSGWGIRVGSEALSAFIVPLVYASGDLSICLQQKNALLSSAPFQQGCKIVHRK